MIIETRTNNIVPKVIFNGSEKVYFKSIHERIIDYTRLGWDVGLGKGKQSSSRCRQTKFIG